MRIVERPLGPKPLTFAPGVTRARRVNEYTRGGEHFITVSVEIGAVAKGIVEKIRNQCADRTRMVRAEPRRFQARRDVWRRMRRNQ